MRKVEDLRARIDAIVAEPPPYDLPPLDVYEDYHAPVAKLKAVPNGHAKPEAEPIRALPPINWGSLEGEPPPRLWWIQDWLGPWPTITSGAGGAGKTRLWQMIATSLATGKPYIGSGQIKPLNVLVWSCEETQDEVWRQQIAINKHFGLEMVDLENLHVVPRQGHENTLMTLAFGQPVLTPLFAQLREQVNDLRADVLVLDNIAQVFGGSENDRHQATYFVNAVSGMVTGRPFAPVFLGHVARAAGSEFSGSAAWENAVRMRWYLGPSAPGSKPDADEEPVEPSTVYLCRRKANYAGKDAIKFNFEDGLLIPERTLSGPEFAASYRADAAEQVVLNGYLRLKDMGITPTDGISSPDYLPAQLLAKQLAQNHTKSELTQALNRLMIKGRFTRGSVGPYPSSRHPKKGLILS